MNRIDFQCQPLDGGTPSLLPLIDGKALTSLVEAYERRSGYTDPAGGYGGIVPSHFRLGPLPSYFVGLGEPTEGGEQGQITALFCECGEAGCWPLTAHVRVEGGSVVVWDRFGQSHRPTRNYAGFGPFRFDLAQYRDAVAAIASFGFDD